MKPLEPEALEGLAEMLRFGLCDAPRGGVDGDWVIDCDGKRRKRPPKRGGSRRPARKRKAANRRRNRAARKARRQRR